MLRFPVIAALLCASGLVVHPARAQQSNSGHKQFLKHKAKAEKGDPKAQDLLGLLYESGSDVMKDEVEAVKWYCKAAVRAFVGHPFHIIKNIFRHRRVRYRGLANGVIGARQAPA